MSNRSYVCWNCREVRRAEQYQEGLIKCPKCSGHCDELGWRARVPKKDDEKGWNLLRQLDAESNLQSTITFDVTNFIYVSKMTLFGTFELNI